MKNDTEHKQFGARNPKKNINWSQNNGKKEKQLLSILTMLVFDTVLTEETVIVTGKENM